MRVPPREIRKARIEIIPMIDTIFFLLVFFIITSLTMVKMKAMGVEMPKNSPQRAASTGDAGTRPHTVILTVSDAGGYYLGRAPINPNALDADVQARLKADPQAVFVLNLAKSQTTQTLIKIMDVLNRVRTPDGRGVHALIATEPVDKDGRALAAPPPEAPHVP